MKTALALTAFFGIVIGWAEMGVLPAEPSLNDLDLPQLTQRIKVIEPRICEPNRSFSKDCNICKCNTEGTSYSCTKKGCEGFNVDIKSGVTLFQKKKEETQVDEVDNFDRYRREVEQDAVVEEGITDDRDNVDLNNSENKFSCVPGEKVKRFCNTCICNNLGTELACTRMQCVFISSKKLISNQNDESDTDKVE